MPIYSLNCSVCNKTYKKLIKDKKLIDQEKCVVCKAQLFLGMSQVTTQTTEVIDNGIMVKQVEKLMHVEELLHDRAHQSTNDVLEFV